jgi:hypothetical protein
MVLGSDIGCGVCHFGRNKKNQCLCGYFSCSGNLIVNFLYIVIEDKVVGV